MVRRLIVGSPSLGVILKPQRTETTEDAEKLVGRIRAPNRALNPRIQGSSVLRSRPWVGTCAAIRPPNLHEGVQLLIVNRANGSQHATAACQ